MRRPDLRRAGSSAPTATGCASCNEHKAGRTPFEADLVLLDPPTAEQIERWTAEGLVLFPPPWITPAITNRITDESPTDHRQTSDPISDRDGDTDGDPIAPDAAQAHPETGSEQPDHLMDHRQEGFGSGRVGRRPDGGSLGVLGQPVRDASDPDIYHRRSRAPTQPDRPP